LQQPPENLLNKLSQNNNYMTIVHNKLLFVNNCGAACRRRGHPTFVIDDLGFRIAKSLQQDKKDSFI